MSNAKTYPIEQFGTRMAQLNYTAVGARIRSRRKALKLTLERLSEMADISTTFLGHIELGTRKASVETLVGIADALDTDIGTLIPQRSLGANDFYRHLLDEIVTLIANNTDLLKRRH